MLQLISQTHSLIKLAQAKDWEQFALQLAQREKLIAQVFKDFDPQSADQETQALFIELQTLNRSLTQLVESQQKSLGSELSALKHGSKAKKAYSTTKKQQ